MGQQQSQSKDELLYEQVNYGNVEGIKALRSEGAGLENNMFMVKNGNHRLAYIEAYTFTDSHLVPIREAFRLRYDFSVHSVEKWIDGQGKTPLIAACMNPQLYDVAKILIELGANLNAYRPGDHAGTPLHHAAKRGLDHTVKLLLAHGANALLMNDACQTPLDVARAKGYKNVVRAIEEHVCLFSGWLRELHGPGFLELLAPQLLSKKVWVVILPCGSRNLLKPLKLELAIYTGEQDAQPRTIVPLWKANLEEPNFNQPDPVAVIADVSRIRRRWRRRRTIKSSQEARRTRIKLAPLQESDKQQLQHFCNACKGIPQVMHPMPRPLNSQVTTSSPATAPPTSEDEELAMAINASLQEAPPLVDVYVGSVLNDASTSGSVNISSSHEESGAHMTYGSSKSEGVQEAGPSDNNVSTPAASAPPVVNDDGPIQYPSIDIGPVDLGVASREENKEEDTSGTCCTICLDAAVEGACVPCGHMAGCMSCLSEIKAKNWGCPVCRTKIDQVIRIYAV